jgi:hypothetical protein
MAYYRAGWAPEVRPLFESNLINGNFWNTVSGNFLDMCVLEWCKLFGGRNEKHSWARITKDRDVFKMDLLQHLELEEGTFEEDIRIFREYRDKWVAHRDREQKGLYPRLETASKAVWFYYRHICKEQIDQAIGPKAIEIGYKECEQEASMVYRLTLDNLRS